MKIVKGGKTYNTETMTIICSKSAYHNGTYSGSHWIGITPNGALAHVQDSNGQDLYREEWLEPITKEEIADIIDGWKLDENEMKALTEMGVITQA